MEGVLDDVLVNILGQLVNLATLLQASRVCKKWRYVITSPWFRAEWRKRHEWPNLLLVTAYNFDWLVRPRPQKFLVWNPAQASSPPLPLPAWMKIPLPPNTFDIVAASHGLVAARHPSWSNLDTPGAEFTVGNPALNQWVRIPRLNEQEEPGRLYTMNVDPASGEFELLDWNNRRVYESCSGSWVPFWAVPRVNNVLDYARRKVLVLKKPIHTEVFSHLGCACAVWEYQGKHYMAQPWTSDHGYRFYKVWCLKAEGEYQEVASWKVPERDENWYVDDSLVVECQAEGNLVCFTGQCRDFYDSHEYSYRDPRACAPYYGDPLPVVAYDLEQCEWFLVPADRGLHHRRAVVFRPSAVKPAGCGDKGLSVPEFDPGELLWHKRKREEEPSMASTRMTRSRRFRTEPGEDVFFL